MEMVRSAIGKPAPSSSSYSFSSSNHHASIVSLLLVLLIASSALAGEPINATTVVERKQTYVGEAFVVQIQVRGSDKPEAPDLSALRDFAIEAVGGQPQNSEMTTHINGKVAHIVRRAYIFAYRFTPRRAGDLEIPALQVTVEGTACTTNPVSIKVKEPAETDDFKLRMALSADACTVGEPVILTVTWYLRKDVSKPAFRLPVLGSDAFSFDDVTPPTRRTRQRVLIHVNRTEITGDQGTGSLDGKTFTTVSFSKALIPRKAGTHTLLRATVSCETIVGHSSRRDFFGNPQPVYERIVVPSNQPTLVVRPLPSERRPANFAGHVGAYRLEAHATPTEVNVGDPITLTIRVSGPLYLKSVELPPLQRQTALAKDFRIPAERAEARIQGDAKVFTQTLRALGPDVAAIPPIELPYFDSAAGEYRVARSERIPLTVRPTRIVTAQDAEGRALAPLQTELQAMQEGIAANHEDLSVLEDQDFGLSTIVTSPFWMVLLGLPPLAWLALFAGASTVRRRRADPASVEARRAASLLARELSALASDDADVAGQVLTSLRGYLGRKLRIPQAAITFTDVSHRLHDAGVGDKQVAALEALFHECEAGRYAGHTIAGDAPLPDRALALVRELDRRLP